MTPAGMVALRIAATLAHALPGLRVRIRDGHRTLVEIAHPAHATGPAIGPCAFRMAVARAHEEIKAGARLAFMGLPAGAEPAVDIGVRSGDQSLPGGICRLSVGDQTVHGFATTLSPRQCRNILARDELPMAVEAVRLHYDAATEITLVHTVSQTELPAEGDRRLLEEVLVAFVADEVLHELAGAAG